MAHHSHVPKFGNWESEENVPYTAYFDKARKTKGVGGGKIMNPNDPQENPDILSKNAPGAGGQRASLDLQGAEPGAAKPKHEHHSSREDARGWRASLDLQGAEPGAAKPKHEQRSSREDAGGRRASGDFHQRAGDLGVSSGDNPRRANRQGGGSDRSVEQSPLHPHYQARVGGRGSGSGSGVSSPAWERKLAESGHGLAPNTPGRSRLRAAQGDETPDKGAAVPKFGEWDESDPSSADRFTHIFNKVREEKHGGSANASVIPKNSPYRNGQKSDHSDGSTVCFCFSWGKK